MATNHSSSRTQPATPPNLWHPPTSHSQSAQPPIAALIRIENCTSRPVGGTVRHDATVEVGRTPWIRLQTITYTNDMSSGSGGESENGKDVRWRKWDMATRTTRKGNGSGVSDAVAVFARVKPLGDDGQPRVLLVQQYRPAVDAITVELPAGLIDPGESPADAALRELREETGYTGVVSGVLPPAPLSPGLSDESVTLVVVDVTGATTANTADAPTNEATEPQYPCPEAQKLDEPENIHVVSVPVARLHDALVHMATVQDMHIMHAVWTLGVGISLGIQM